MIPVEQIRQGEQPRRANILGALAQGCRLALFLRPSVESVTIHEGSWSTLVGLVFLAVAPGFVATLLEVGPKGSFVASGLPGALFGVPVTLVGGWALGRLAGRPEKTLLLIIALASLATPLEVVRIALGFAVDVAIARSTSPEEAMFAYLPRGIVPLWLTSSATVAAVRLLEVPRRRWLAAGVATSLLVVLPLVAIQRDRILWSPRYDATAAAKYEDAFGALRNEDVFYLQPRILERELARLRPGRRGVIDLYFIGVAAYAGQDVFMKEVRSVAKLFDDRFDTRGRSLALINNPATVRTSPIATATSLDLALKRVAEVMDRDEDILFLFITSHGSKDHQATFDFWPMHLDPIDPARLRKMLDRSGIKRRVVVVSACYSGTFVDALRDDWTLAIAASAGDKKSFGCSNEADFTYFGKAYFDEALRHTYSFSEGFEIAAPVIAERERKASFDGSDPKMFVGARIRRALERFVKARKAAVMGNLPLEKAPVPATARNASHGP